MCTPLWRGTMAVYRFLASALKIIMRRITIIITIIVVIMIIIFFSALVANPKKTTLHVHPSSGLPLPGVG